ncbi:MAG: Dam family site-specific DNA-(adenine-N6)-methyltransferase [Anaerolineaceae bacterium]|nr:MAG: Dam family site-specific DNA-(adenine-N6)-methyltransferase [Anaerolineaceae bacterium]
MTINVPPIKCQGIKTKLVEWIKDHSTLENTGTWIEPFMGSGVVGFNMRPNRAVFADVNPHIINFYNAIKQGKITAGIAKEFLEKEGAQLKATGEEHYYAVRERFNKEGEPLDMLFLNRACFNGVMRFNQKGNFNVPFGHKPERFAKAYVTKIANQIKYVSQATSQYDWQFICADFRQTISSASEGDFIYCDPPYIGRHVDYFNSWSENDEQELYELLSTTPAKFILSTWHSNKYRSNPAIEKYAYRFTILTREHFYHVGAKEENRNPMLEAIVLNYNPLPQFELQLEKQLALFEKSHKPQFVLYSQRM